MPNPRCWNPEAMHRWRCAVSDLEITIANLRAFGANRKFKTIYADPPWQFQNRTGKVAPEHKRLARYPTMPLEEIKALPVGELADTQSHLYLWVPNALLPWGLEVMAAWGFEYKSNIVWEKIRKDGQPDGRGVGFYFRNVTELLLFGVRGRNNRTLPPGRSQVNLIRVAKREHSRKPDEIVSVIEACSPGPYLELFARGDRPGWAMWGNQATPDYEPTWPTYSNHTIANDRNQSALNCVYPVGEEESAQQLLLAMEPSLKDGGEGRSTLVSRGRTVSSSARVSSPKKGQLAHPLPRKKGAKRTSLARALRRFPKGSDDVSFTRDRSSGRKGSA